MADINACCFTGRLGADIPQPSEAGNGKKFVKFMIASNNSYKKAAWIPCTAYGQQAIYLANYGKKGDLVTLETEYNSFQKSDGTFGSNFNVKNVELHGRMSSKGNDMPVTEEDGLPDAISYDDDDEDVPF